MFGVNFSDGLDILILENFIFPRNRFDPSLRLFNHRHWGIDFGTYDGLYRTYYISVYLVNNFPSRSNDYYRVFMIITETNSLPCSPRHSGEIYENQTRQYICINTCETGYLPHFVVGHFELSIFRFLEKD